MAINPLDLNNRLEHKMAWRRLCTTDGLFKALRQAVEKNKVDEAASCIQRHALYKWNNELFNELFNELRALLCCARIAALPLEQAQKLPELLRDVDDKSLSPKNCVSAALREEDWPVFLRDVLTTPCWPQPLNAAWAWDAVSSLAGRERPVKSSARSNALLVMQERNANGDGRGIGIRATLCIDVLGDKGGGAFYPDPRLNSLLKMDADFAEALDTAKRVASRQGKWPENYDLRWSLRCDKGPLLWVADTSAGAAFAAVLLKALAQAQR